MENAFRAGNVTTYSKGELIPAGMKIIHFVSHGYVGMYSNVDGIRRLLFVYKAGDVFPFAVNSIIISDREYVFIALSKLTLHTLAKSSFDELVQNPAIGQLLLANLQEIVQLQFERIDNLQKGQILERLVERLLFFAKRVGIPKGEKVVIDVQMSHVDLASSIGTSRETVNRYMKQLEQLEVIEISHQRITIKSLDRLTYILDKKALPARPNWSLLPAAIVATAVTVDGVIQVMGNFT